MKRILFLVLFFSSVSSYAQMNVGSLLSATSEKITSTNYYYARPNDLTMIVNVVGFVQRPGRYEIATTIDLVNLLSLAGGPTSDGALNKIKITRIVKDGDRVSRKEIDYNLEDLTQVRSEDLGLMPGDVISMGRTSWSQFRDGFSVFVSAAIITSAVAQVINASKR